jgi:ATP-binding cassette, subfamily B, multidrug efflux pump
MFFQKKNEELYDKNFQFVKYIVGVNISISIALNFVILVIITFGSFLVINRSATGLTAGELTEYMSYFFSLIWPVMALSQFIQIQSQAKASASRIEAFLDAEIEVKDSPDAEHAESLDGNIQVKNLTFQYPDGDSPVLENVSF